MAVLDEKKGRSTSPIAVDRYPAEKSSYTLQDRLGLGVNATVFKAVCDTADSAEVAIKIIDLEKSKADPTAIQAELKKNYQLTHRNLLKPYCSFEEDSHFWVVMRLMSGGSLQYIMDNVFSGGMPEQCIATVLKEVLNALWYLHGEGHVHKDIKAGNILINSNGAVKLADYGVSSSIYECYSTSDDSSKSILIDVSGNPYWISPEALTSPAEYTCKADIWAFGIVAMELAHANPPVSAIPQSNSLNIKISKRFQFPDGSEKPNGTKKAEFSPEFREMVGMCLDEDPSSRPAAEELLTHPFFKKSQGTDFLIDNVLKKLPGNKVVPAEEAKIEKALALPTENGKETKPSGWKFNGETFKLDPVFYPKGGKKSRPTDPYDQFMLERLTSMKDSCIEQKKLVQKLIEMVRSYELSERKSGEQIMDLKLKLDDERMRRFNLEMKLECMNQWEKEDSY